MHLERRAETHADRSSTMVIDGHMLKVLAWYDNEFGYAFRMADLAAKVAAVL